MSRSHLWPDFWDIPKLTDGRAETVRIERDETALERLYNALLAYLERYGEPPALALVSPADWFNLKHMAGLHTGAVTYAGDHLILRRCKVYPMAGLDEPKVLGRFAVEVLK